MNKVLLAIKGIVLIGIAFYSGRVSQGTTFLGLPIQCGVDRDSLFVLFCGLFGIVTAIRPIPMTALLLGSFFSGPLITCGVAGMIVYERYQRNDYDWFSFKDYFFLMLLAASCGLPEPIRSLVTLVGALGVSLDFGKGSFFLMPVVLFTHTTLGGEVAPEWVCGIALIFFLAHLFWVGINGHAKARALWINSQAIYLLSFAFIFRDHEFVPILVMTVILNELLAGCIWNGRPRSLWVAGLISVLLAGLPFFVGNATSAVLIQSNLIWAIALFSWMMTYSALAFVDGERFLGAEQMVAPAYKLPLWAAFLGAALSLNCVWWRSVFSPQFELGKWGIGFGLMEVLFNRKSDSMMSLDQNSFFIALGVSVLGIVLAVLLFRFFRPKDHSETINAWLGRRSSSFSEPLRELGQMIQEEHGWLSSIYEMKKVGIEDYIQAISVGLILIALILASVYFLRMGSSG